MRELRLSIPFVGGVTAVFTEEEVKQHKDNLVKHVSIGASKTWDAAVWITGRSKKMLGTAAGVSSVFLSNLADTIQYYGE